MVMPTATITLGELITYVKRQFGDESGVQIIDSDIIRWTNMAAIEIVTKNKVLQATATVTGVAGQQAYSMNDIPGLIDIEDVSYGTTNLIPTDKSGIQKLLGSSGTEAGAPVYWYMWANEIRMWPVPNTAETLTVDYVKKPPNVTSSGDLLPLPDVYFERLCNFVMSKAYELDEDLPNSSGQRQLFEDKLTEMTGIGKSMSGSFPVVRDDYEGGYYAGYDTYGGY